MQTLADSNMTKVLDTKPNFAIWSEDELRLAARVMEVPHWDCMSRQELAARLHRLIRD